MLLRSALSASPEVRQAMHFDTLWAQANEQLQILSGQLWSDTAEHDPGVTLLQALNYAVADLAYRHALALQDLLTPAPEAQSTEGLFPADFGPQRTLTVSPVTGDDYRRALLDLTSDDGQLLFRNAQLLKEAEDERYRYYFSAANREFWFSGSAGEQAFTVLGQYRLQVELNRGITRAQAEPVLSTFLLAHRNICEGVRSIDWLDVQPADVALTLELEDDFMDFPGVMVRVYQAVEAFISPQAQRQTAQQLRERGFGNDVLYEGPMLDHGWIMQLPPACDYQSDRAININPLAATLLALDGVSRLQTLAFDGSGWTGSIAALHYLQLWGDDPWQVLADGELVRLMKRGQQVHLSRDEIINAFTPAGLIQEVAALLPYGQHRTPLRYYPVTGKIPPCYDLQTAPSGAAAIALHRFLLPFEQQLANGCDQLAMLPGMLSFRRDIAAPSKVWGAQWPFVAGSLSDTVHAGYRPALEDAAQAQALSVEQELLILNYLLGYFGQQRADRTLMNAPDYLASQRHYLSQNSLLYYEAAQFRTTAISAIQRRIAARLGFASSLFDAEANMRALPFYLVEHLSLLPVRPGAAYDDWSTLATVDAPLTGQLELTPAAAVQGVLAGQLLELRLTSSTSTDLVISACVVLDVAADGSRITLEVNAQMRAFLDELTDPATTVEWRNSNMWLQDISFPLDYVLDPQDWLTLQPGPGQRVITASNLSGELRIGSVITLYRHLASVNLARGRASGEEIDARVSGLDNLRRQALIEAVEGGPPLPDDNLEKQYRWRIRRDPVDGMTDRYSFTVSVVFRDDLLNDVVEPYTTEAWIRQIVQQELPCHVNGEIHWMDAQYFASFADSYARWIQADAGLGIHAFNLLEKLGLGLLPSGLVGINVMRIATAEQRDQVIGINGNEWNTDVIEANNLFYVPPELQR